MYSLIIVTNVRATTVRVAIVRLTKIGDILITGHIGVRCKKFIMIRKVGEVGMKDHKVPVQSLIDHIKTAIDVDDWAKEMAEELLKEQETEDTGSCRVFQCKKCGFGIDDIFVNDEEKYQILPRYCPNCGRSVKWNE